MIHCILVLKIAALLVFVQRKWSLDDVDVFVSRGEIRGNTATAKSKFTESVVGGVRSLGFKKERLYIHSAMSLTLHALLKVLIEIDCGDGVMEVRHTFPSGRSFSNNEALTLGSPLSTTFIKQVLDRRQTTV